MTDSVLQEIKKRKKEEENTFNELRDDLIEKINQLINHQVLSEIEEREILTKIEVNNIKSIFKNLLIRIEREFNTVLSKWVLDSIKNNISNLGSFFYTLKISLDKNREDPSVKFIGSEVKRTFKEYAEIILMSVVNLDNIVDYLWGIYQDFKLQSQNITLETNNDFLAKLQITKDVLEKEVDEFRTNRNIADNAKTENIYDQAVIKYRGLENDYRFYFYWALGLTVGISLGTFFLKKILVPDFLGNVEFWVLKVSILVVGITLITYFLKQSSHYQHLADQNYQTQVELQAYPSFMESIPTEEAASVRKELALKYFGREIDGSAHKDMGNLISDQMKSTTDMVKATTEAIKSLNGKGGT